MILVLLISFYTLPIISANLMVVCLNEYLNPILPFILYIYELSLESYVCNRVPTMSINRKIKFNGVVIKCNSIDPTRG
jgi:hypothetical protein